MARPKLQRARVPVAGGALTFWCETPGDAIQGAHLRGELWDRPELEEIARHVTDGDVIVDVGANVGNHAVYLAHHFPRSPIYVFEPNAEAARLLRRNLDANACDLVRRDYIGAGLSDETGPAVSWRGGPGNLGNSKLMNMSQAHRAQQNPALFNLTKLHRGDEIFAETRVDFIKIDVEGHEMACLRGLTETIARDRPKLFAEVQNEGLAAFDALREAWGYEVVWRDAHYAKVTNVLMVAG